LQVEEKLEYKGAKKSDTKTLEIGNQGGNALIRFSNIGLGIYSSNNDKQIIHDGTLLKKLKIAEEQLQFKVSFDMIIETENHEYKAEMNLDFPSGNIIEQGTVSMEKTDMKDVIFKRVK